MTARKVQRCAHPECDNEGRNQHLVMVKRPAIKRFDKVAYVLCSACERSRMRRDQASRAVSGDALAHGAELPMEGA